MNRVGGTTKRTWQHAFDAELLDHSMEERQEAMYAASLAVPLHWGPPEMDHAASCAQPEQLSTWPSGAVLSDGDEARMMDLCVAAPHGSAAHSFVPRAVAVGASAQARLDSGAAARHGARPARSVSLPHMRPLPPARPLCNPNDGRALMFL